MDNNINENENMNTIVSEDEISFNKDEFVRKLSLKQRIMKKIPTLSVDNYRFIVFLFSVFTIALCVIRIIAIEKSVDFPGFSNGNQSYRLSRTVYTDTFFILYLIGLGFAFLVSLFSHGINFGTNKRSNLFVFVSSLAGFCMVGCAGFFIYRITLVETVLGKLDYWVIIFMLLTGAYFAMDSVGFVSEKTKPWFSIGVVFFGIFRLVSEFISHHQLQKYSSNEYHLVGLALLLCFLCSNARFHISEKTGIGYTFFGLFAALTLLVYAIPEMYISLFKPYYVDSVFVFCIVDVVMAFYIFSKLLSVSSPKKKTKCAVEKSYEE